MKINLLLLTKILLIEIVYFLVMFFLLSLLIIEYYTSGASAPKIVLLGDIGDLIVFIPPIVFNFYKIITLNRKKETGKLWGYAIPQVLIFLYINYKLYVCFLYYYNMVA